MVDLIQINWKKDWLRLRAGWDVPADLHRGDLLLSISKLRRVPQDIRDPKIKHRFEALIKNTTFISWWDQFCGREKDKLFTLNFPDNACRIPWELLIERLRATRLHSTVSLVRTDANAIKPEAPSVFDEPMKSLILLGDDGTSIGLKRLDLSTEVEQLQSAWQELESGIRRCVNRPVVCNAKRVELPGLLREFKPHVLWFSGHGFAKPETTLLFAGGDKVTSKEFADLIEQSGQTPLYAVFWACDTGIPDARTSTVSVTPAFFRELSRVGVLAVLGMQSPIRDVSARTMAANLFRHLASGTSLERSLARTRALLMEDRPTEAHPLDWACPVIWSASTPVENLKFNSAQQPFVKFQLTGRWALRLGFESPAVLISRPTEEELRRAHAWTSQRGTWVIDPSGLDNTEDRIAWLRTLQAIPAEKYLFVLPISFVDRTNAEQALKRWAQSTYEQLRPGDVPSEFSEAIRQMCDLPFVGWQQLCAIPNLYLAIVDAPRFNPQDLFWQPLLDSNGPYIAIISNEDIPFEADRNWSVDKIEQKMDLEQMGRAIQQAPRLARALAVLNMPLNSSLIYLSAESCEAITRLSDWPNRNDVLVQTSAGPIIRAIARQYILERLTPEEQSVAHRDCIEMMTRPEMYLTPQIRELLVIHRLGANQINETVAEVMNLLRIYYITDRHFAIANLIERIGTLKERIPARYRLIIAGAYLQLNMLDHAQRWLDLSKPESVMDHAWQHAMQAEIFKSEGTQQHRENALAQIEAAIKLCQDAVQSPKTQQESLEKIKSNLLVYRQDRARILQYLFAGREHEAAAEYATLIRELSNRPASALDLAAVKRNYSELLRKRVSSKTDTEYQQARELLNEAEQLARSDPPTPILAEVLYEKAKFAEDDNQFADARDYLEECIKTAEASQQYMTRAIARSRHFWKYEQFALARWNEIETQLRIFRHGWALRTLIDGSLKAARKFEAKGDLKYSLASLEANRSALFGNPSFDQGSDRGRILSTYAGLAVINNKLDQPFAAASGFIETYPWLKDWLNNKTMRDLEAIWKEIV